MYTPLLKKHNAWFGSSHDPSLGSVTPKAQKVISRGSELPVNNFLPLWVIDPKLGPLELLNIQILKSEMHQEKTLWLFVICCHCCSISGGDCDPIISYYAYANWLDSCSHFLNVDTDTYQVREGRPRSSWMSKMHTIGVVRGEDDT